MNIKISFIVPTYKRPELLLRCIVSIKEQVKIPHEIIVVDDSTLGEAANITQPFDVTYVRKSSQDRRGLSANRNIGIRFSKGEFLVFIDDDDFLISPALEEMILGSLDADLVCANHYEYRNDSLVPINVGDFSMEKMLIFNRFPVGSYAVRRSAIRYIFDEDMRSHEDWDFLLKNINYFKVQYYNLFPIVIDKSTNLSDSHMGKTREYFWLDFLSVYARFPCPQLSEARAAMLKTLGLEMPASHLMAKPYINQINF